MHEDRSSVNYFPRECIKPSPTRSLLKAFHHWSSQPLPTLESPGKFSGVLQFRPHSKTTKFEYLRVQNETHISFQGSPDESNGAKVETATLRVSCSQRNYLQPRGWHLSPTTLFPPPMVSMWFPMCLKP